MSKTADAEWSRLLLKLKRIVWRRGVSDVHVNDVVQTAVERALRNIDSLQKHDRFEAWISGIAANAAIDHLRSSSRAPIHLDLDDAFDVPIVQTNNSPLNSYADCIEPFLDGLPPADRDAIYLKDLRGLNYAELACEMQLTVPGAKSRVQRARHKLAKAILRCCNNPSVEPCHGETGDMCCELDPRK
ncbi:MAG: sigma-70 family RNA polymerase sigma factor [Pseudomonadota bacterium]